MGASFSSQTLGQMLPVLNQRGRKKPGLSGGTTEGLGSRERSLKFGLFEASSASLKIWILVLIQQLPPPSSLPVSVRCRLLRPQTPRESLLQVHSLIVTLELGDSFV